MKLTFTKLSNSLVIDYTNICYCKAINNYTEVIIKGGESKLLTKTLKSVEDILPSHMFFRASKSFLVNLTMIIYIESNYKTIVINNGDKIKVTGNRHQELSIIFERQNDSLYK